MNMPVSRLLQALVRWVALVALCGLGLQIFFVARIASMRYLDPVSTAFQRSEAMRIARHNPS